MIVDFDNLFVACDYFFSGSMKLNRLNGHSIVML